MQSAVAVRQDVSFPVVVPFFFRSGDDAPSRKRILRRALFSSDSSRSLAFFLGGPVGVGRGRVTRLEVSIVRMAAAADGPRLLYRTKCKLFEINKWTPPRKSGGIP